MQAAMATGEEVPTALAELVRPHIDSYDWFVTEGIRAVVDLLEPVEVQHPITNTIHRFWWESPAIGRPLNEERMAGSMDKRLMPRDCREGVLTYKAAVALDFCYQRAEGPVQRVTRRMGQLPVMVKSRLCYLRNMSRSELVRHKEESVETGGYFICQGIERIIRLLILPRRHYIMALRRPAFLQRGKEYTDAATIIRCVRRDEASATVRCHYLKDGRSNFCFMVRKSEYFMPAGIVLKALMEVSDRELFEHLVAVVPQDPSGDTNFVMDRVELLLLEVRRYGLVTRAQAVEYLGSLFRGILGTPPYVSDFQAGEQMLRECVFIHLTAAADKWALLVAMLGKLWALWSGRCCPDSPDALTHQELLLPGHLLARTMTDKLGECLSVFSEQVRRDLLRAPEKVNLQDEAYIKKTCDKMPDIGKRLLHLLNTGNLQTRTGLDISQTNGFTVVAEKLNFFRFISHFRSVHRGAYFAQMRTTTVRKLLPESWGFVCPVHTPDGSPCGLLNHLTAMCSVVMPSPEAELDSDAICKVLAAMGMVPISMEAVTPPPPAYLTVHLDGRVVGHVRGARAPPLLAALRRIKAARLLLDGGGDPSLGPPVALRGMERRVPAHLEVVHMPHEHGGPFPGIFLFTQGSRMARPVRQLPGGALELIGTLEQSNMDIRCPDGGPGGSNALVYSHEEIAPTSMLSIIASLTPYSDYNQSPRNMYQCQMGKQTLGSPAQSYAHRTDGKLYRIQTPQTPIARTRRYDEYCMDEFPSGTNMVVAVLAYTGYDMEDAMILNKSAVERGLAHATIIKTEQIDLRDEKGKDMYFATLSTLTPRPHLPAKSAFGDEFPQNVPVTSAQDAAAKKLRQSANYDHSNRIGVDGLPHVGAVVYPGQEYYSRIDKTTDKVSYGKLKGEEIGTIDHVTVIGSGKEGGLRQANITMRFNRNPVIGDKFSSRHGQKGVLSYLYPDVNMPFCASTGMRPDLIINPHAFPSRMTIGMLMESVVSKAGALLGHFVDATPFQAAEGKATTPLEDCAAALEERGFSRLGGETMVSGITGEEFPADIFIGPVYYQRLRHMVSDKFQVRSTGPTNPLTHQPIKGRKFGGGIRFGEMERDALLAHGAAYLLHDRLHWCSDYSVMDACRLCGSILTPLRVPWRENGPMLAYVPSIQKGAQGHVVCRNCDTGRHVERVALPHVFRYLVAELAAMNIRCTLTLS